MDTYFARLTWNRDNWRRPSGFIARGEHGTYVAKQGYGHEEWLNRAEWVQDGWRYGYIEGASRSPRLIGSKVRLILFSINPSKEHVFVGEIPSAELLTDDDAKAAHKAFRRHGWIAQMIAELEQQIGPAKTFRRQIAGAAGVANIRFRAGGLRMFDAPVPIPAGHVLRRYSRYMLMAAPQRAEVRYREATRRAMLALKSTSVRTRDATLETRVDPVEARMQNEIRQLLERRLGRAAVQAEKDFVDLQVKQGGTVTIIEFKSATDSRKAIRQALGQLLDYAYFNDSGWQPRLLVVGRGVLSAKAERFIKTLRGRFRVPITYKQYVLGSGQFDL
jgi:hypothetical protein